MSATTTAAAPVAPAILDDRLCPGCAFNLLGQPIEREPRYGLLVARCPHCETATAIEEFPPLSRWTARWAMLLAAIWMLVVIAAATATAVTLFGMSFAVAGESTDRAARAVSDRYVAWATPRHSGEQVWTLRSAQPGFAQFWEEQGPAVIASLGGGRLAGLERDEVAILLFPCAFGFALGLFWSLALLQRRRWRAAAAPWVVVGPVIAITFVVWLMLREPYSSVDQVITHRLRCPILLLALPLIGLFLSSGILLGRSLARGVVRAFLPPGLRGPLAFLWTSDGLSAPAPARRRSVS
jgi:hypothetical protein